MNVDTHAHVYVRKFTKQEVGYEHPAKGDYNCGSCKHYEVERQNGCEIVKGAILSEDWCRKWAGKS